MDSNTAKVKGNAHGGKSSHYVCRLVMALVTEALSSKNFP